MLCPGTVTLTGRNFLGTYVGLCTQMKIKNTEQSAIWRDKSPDQLAARSYNSIKSDPVKSTPPKNRKLGKSKSLDEAQFSRLTTGYIRDVERRTNFVHQIAKGGCMQSLRRDNQTLPAERTALIHASSSPARPTTRCDLACLSEPGDEDAVVQDRP